MTMNEMSSVATIIIRAYGKEEEIRLMSRGGSHRDSKAINQAASLGESILHSLDRMRGPRTLSEFCKGSVGKLSYEDASLNIPKRTSMLAWARWLTRYGIVENCFPRGIFKS